MKLSLALLGLCVLSKTEKDVMAKINSGGPAKPGPAVEYCGGDRALYNLDKVKVTPYPPESGKKLRILASGNLTKQITNGATLEIEGKWGIIRVLNQKLDLCSVTKKLGRPCPIKKGSFELKFEAKVPSKIPKVKIWSTITIRDKNQKLISCLNAKIQI